MKARAHVLVNGTVQGVLFRSETKQNAESNGVKGWVRNLPDGRVEAVFEGEEENVKGLVEFCRRGPRGAMVTAIDLSWEAYTGVFRDFRIKYA